MVSSINPRVRLANNFTNRTSATNGANVYNTCLSQPENQPDSWQFDFDLRTEQVWDGFCLLSLLEDHVHHHSVLTVPNDGLQKDRFTAAMKARNLHMQQAGQDEYAHACKKCVRVWEPGDGKPQRKFPCVSPPLALVESSCMQRNAVCSSLTVLPLAIHAAAFSTAQYLLPTTDIVTALIMMATTTFALSKVAFNPLPLVFLQAIQQG